MSELPKESQSTAPVGHPPAVPRPALDTDLRATEQIERKLNVLEASLKKLGKVYPSLKTEDFLEQADKSIYDGVLQPDHIERLTDALDNYDFSERGIQVFNQLLKEGDVVYLCNLLVSNYKAINLPELADLSSENYDILDTAFRDLAVSMKSLKAVTMLT